MTISDSPLLRKIQNSFWTEWHAVLSKPSRRKKYITKTSLRRYHIFFFFKLFVLSCSIQSCRALIEISHYLTPALEIFLGEHIVYKSMFLLGESWNVTLRSPRTLFMQLHTHCELRRFRGKQSLASVWMHTRLRDWRRVRRGWNCLSYHIIMGGGQARWKSWPTASSLKRLWAAALVLRLVKTQQLYVAEGKKRSCLKNEIVCVCMNMFHSNCKVKWAKFFWCMYNMYIMNFI